MEKIWPLRQKIIAILSINNLICSTVAVSVFALVFLSMMIGNLTTSKISQICRMEVSKFSTASRSKSSITRSLMLRRTDMTNLSRTNLAKKMDIFILSVALGVTQKTCISG